MKKIVAALAFAFLLSANVPAQAFQVHPKPHKVMKHKGKRHKAKKHRHP
jgi:hypothetical protein